VGTIVGTGKGGNLSINTGQLVVRDGAQVSVSGLSLDLERGDAGNLEVTAHSIRLDNEGAIAATTTSGNGGDLTLEAREALLLRRDSRISTTAGTAQAGGDGGNMTIDAELIIAIPNENSDITANAFLGQGGRINLTTQGIFGLEIRTREQLQTLLGTNDSTQLDPRQLPSNDITAISQTNPQLSGEIALQSPEVDPSQGLAELPADVVDGARLVEQNLCAASRDSAFTITGRGGLPAPPNETLHTDAAWEDWRITSESEESAGTLSTASVRASEATKNSQQRIVEAQGWYTDTNGNIVLTAEPMAVTPHETWLVSANCQELSHLHEEGVGN
jgi:large exoprotein involved in heme utilization and adhesion